MESSGNYEKILEENKEASEETVLEAEERETIISWCDDDKDGKVFIHTTQRPMMRALLANPLFEFERYHKDPGCNPHGVDGHLPRAALTIRTKLRTYTEEELVVLRERMAKVRERNKKNETGEGL